MYSIDAVAFYSNNVSVAVDFYTSQLGLVLEYPNDDRYASLLFDNGIKLGIKKASEDREIPGAQTLFLSVKDAIAEYKKAQSKGLKIYKPLTEEPWGIEFSILDPDGNKIEFVQNK